MSIQNIQVGDTVPIELQVADGAIDQYPRALVYSEASVLLITIDLAHDNQGNYSGNTYVMPDNEFVKVVYIVYSDSGHTTLNVDYERDLEVFYRILPDEFKANVTALALEATSQTILADTDNLQLNQGNWVTATGFSVPNEYDASLAAIQADLDNPSQYKATGFSVPNEYDTALANIQGEVNGLDGAPMRGTDGANTTVPPTVGAIDTELTSTHGAGSWTEGSMSEAELHTGLDSYANKSEYKASGFSIPNEYDIRLATLQADLDNPNQYKADLTLVALEATSQIILTDTNELQLNQGNWVTATGFSIPNEYDASLAVIQADLDNPDQYKATGFSVPNEYDVILTAVQAETTRILGLTQENQFIDNTVYAGKNLTSARLRIYSDAASVGTALNVTDTYTITAVYTGAGMQTYSMVKV